eukprot:Phypoly_transcript_05458.p1 GENE.Phypoly_transcript_05458~~Phypoly_transcript_05458.p1  ORF type:complete len:527 (+),score=99.15 Phypoly_transcript_05458:312-1892(+)
MSRDKDNREKKPDPASPTTTCNNVKDENMMHAKALKRKSLEENEVASGVYDSKQVSVIVKEDVMDPVPEQDANVSPPQNKKKVKAKIKIKQRSKPDLSAFNSPPSNPPPHISSSPPQQKVIIDTKINTTIPNATNTFTNTNTQNPNATISTLGLTPTTNTTRTISKSDALPSTKTKEAGSTQQQDKMQKLSFLTDLYEQGYITVVEYKERKSQIIDELTGTRTRTRNNSHIMQPPTVVASPPPDWSTIREETALRHVFDTVKNQWSTTVVKVKLDKEPFACGGLRKCYHLHDCTRPEDNYVAKLSIDPFEDHDIYFIDVEIQMHSKEFARKFNQYNPPKNVDFVMAWLLELIEREGRPLCGVETFIEGPYRKHNNNFGYVSEDERNTPQAFSHFTYEASNHKILICDIQGVADLYTDPQMHTIDIKKAELMGKGNMGVRGISKFLATHQCNAICRYLRLPSINAKLIDAGTVPATTYMSYQKVDVINIECYHPSPLPVGQKTDASPLLDPPDATPATRACCACTIL